MAKPKVFLSISRQGDRIMFEAMKISLLTYNIEVVEVGSGPYSAAPMLECDVLAIIPPLQSSNTPFKIKLGKGQTNEIEEWIGKKSPKTIIVVDDTNSATSNKAFRFYKEFDNIQNGSWSNDYSTIEVSSNYSSVFVVKVQEALKLIERFGNKSDTNIPQVKGTCNDIVCNCGQVVCKGKQPLVSRDGKPLVYGTPGPDLDNLEQFFSNKPKPMLALSRARK